MALLRDSQLFSPSLFGSRLVGRARLPSSMLSEASGEAELKLEGSRGGAIVGMNGRRAVVSVRWERLPEGGLCLTVLRARNMQKVDRIGLCDAQVIVELGGQVKHTKIVRGTLNPEFLNRMVFPSTTPASPGGGGGEGARLTVIHRDQEEQLMGLAERCEVVVVEKGTLLQRSGDKPDQMLILQEGTIGLFESLTHSGPHGARARTRKSQEPAPGQLPPPKGSEDLYEVARVSQRGACLGEEALLMGETPRITAVALTRCVVMWVGAKAMGAALRGSPQLCERLALSVVSAETDYKEGIAGGEMTVHLTVHGANSLPTDVSLDWGESDPSVYLECEGQRAHTLSVRNTRRQGEDPVYDETFVFEGIKDNRSCLSISLCDVDKSGVYERVIGRQDLRIETLKARRRVREEFALSRPDKGSMHHFRAQATGDAGPQLSMKASHRLFALKHHPHKLHEGLVMSLGKPDWVVEDEERSNPNPLQMLGAGLGGAKKPSDPVGWVPYEER